MDWSTKFSDKALRMKGSAIRQLLALTQKPEIISFAGGLPDPALFPFDEFARCMDKAIREKPGVALQYGETPGFRPLRELIVQMMTDEGIKDCTIDNICVTTSSQQAIDLVGKTFVTEGDYVIVEGPTYLAALQSWNVYGAKYITIDMDDEGMKIDMLEAKLKECDAKGIKPKFIYTIPTFQNPAGITMNLERRKKLLEIASARQIPIVEDNPYGDLRFLGEPLPSLSVLDTNGIVINLRTFSKIMFPGIRVGWIYGPKDAAAKIMTAKEASDLCTPVLTQAAVAEFIKMGVLKTHIPKIRASYGHKREMMVEAMKKEFPSDAKWTNAEGGMFIWATLNEKINCTDLFPKALENNVAYIVGSAFFAEPGRGHNTMRLNFSFPTEENIKEGIRRLGTLLKSI